MTAAVRGFRSAPRPVGAALAAGISLAVSAIFWAAAATDVLRAFVGRELLVLVSIGAAIGVPVGAVVGWITVPKLLSARDNRLWLPVPLATWAVLLGAPLVAIALAFQTSARPDGDLSTLAGLVGLLARSVGEIVAMAVIALLFGMIMFGLPAWVLAAAVSALWIPAVDKVLGSALPPVADAVPEDPRSEAVSPSDPAAPRFLGWVAVGAALAIALALTWLRARGDDPPGMLAGGLVGFLAAFAGPGLVAAVGLRRGRPDIIVAAAVALICLAPLSMGGAAFPLLIPAVILLYVAGKLRVPGLPGWLRAATAVVTIGFLVAAPVALFSTTEVVCWETLGGGRIVTRVLPNMPNEYTSSAPFGSGCSGGEISVLGGSLAVLAVAGAVAVAASSGWKPDLRP